MLRALLTIGGLQLLTMLVLLVRTKALAVLFGPDAVGIMAVIDKLVAVIAQTASFSLPFAALRFLPPLWHGDRTEFYRLLRAMSAVLAALACAAVAGGLVTSAVRPALWGSQLLSYRSLVLVAMLTIPVTIFVPFVQNALASTLQHPRAMLFGLAHAVVQAVTGLIGALLRSLAVLYATYAAAGGVLVGWVLLRLRNAPGAPSAPPFGWNRQALPGAQVWRFSMFFAGLAFLSPYAALYVHYRILADFGATQAGWMQGAMGVALAVRTVLGSANQVFLSPQVNRRPTPAEQVQWASEFQNTWCLLTGIVVPPLLLAPNLALQTLYAASFRPGAEFVYLFVLTEVVKLLAGSYQPVIIAADRLVFNVGQNMIAQLITVIGAWALIPRFGISGAALAGLAAQVFLLLTTMGYLAWRFGLRAPLRTSVLTCYLIAALLVTGVVGSHGTGAVGTDLLRALVGYALTVLGLAAFLTKAEWARLRQFVRSAARAGATRT
jgi:PST family polysaccharide transporter